MNLKFKFQPYQAHAVDAVLNCLAGQPKSDGLRYRIELATHKPVRVVFRDNGFLSGAVKINVEQIFRQLSPVTDVKSI